MAAVGSYIQTLREEQDVKQKYILTEVSRRVGRNVVHSTIWRVERGKTTPRTDILSALVEVLGGSGDDVAGLSNNPDASVSDGREAALRHLRGDQVERIDRLIETTEPDDLVAIIEELRREYERDSNLITFLRGALAGWHARGSGPRRQKE